MLREHQLHDWSQTSFTDNKIIPLGEIQNWIELLRYYKKIMWEVSWGQIVAIFQIKYDAFFPSHTVCGVRIKQKSRCKNSTEWIYTSHKEGWGWEKKCELTFNQREYQ